MFSPNFLTVENILAIHTRLITEFGGEFGLRDRGLLESATVMPRSMFSGEFLHKTLAEMAAAYHFHLCSNHPFIDGNKRIAVTSAEFFLLLNGWELKSTDDELEIITQELASGNVSKEQVTKFFAKYAIRYHEKE